MTRAAWRRLRELLVSRRRQDPADLADEPAEEDAGTPGREGGTGPAHPAPVPEGSVERIVGCSAVLALLFVSSVSTVALSMPHDSWDASWKTVTWIVVSLVIAIPAAALAWWGGKALQRRRKGPIGANPPVERTEDDQSSVGKP